MTRRFDRFAVLLGPSSKKLQLIQDQLHETSSQSMIVSVDRVFSGSARLDGDAIGTAVSLSLSCFSPRPPS